ncbi:MAG: hypothetical protein H8E27_14495 [Verrucomicrobia subdivision 3 bacterium]|nr:hypothetical protein [Limisphaerales bacterium]
MTDRQWVLEKVGGMPEDASAPEILEDLALQTTLRRRLAEGGGATPNEQVSGLIDEWIAKSNGSNGSTGKTKPSTT